MTGLRNTGYAARQAMTIPEEIVEDERDPHPLMSRCPNSDLFKNQMAHLVNNHSPVGGIADPSTAKPPVWLV